MYHSSEYYLCPKAAERGIRLKNRIRTDFPELKKACEMSPYFTSFDHMYWFRDCTYSEGWTLAEKAIRSAVLEEAIKEVPKLTWLEKCFIW